MEKDYKEARNDEWRVELRNKMTAKERAQIDRIPMPKLDPTYRVTCNEEVCQGLSVEQAMQEAKRCIDCANPGCVQGCPVGNNIPEFIKYVECGDFKSAAATLKKTNSLSAVCGRVCPQEEQCEGNCIRLKMKQPAVAIGNLERFVADWVRENNAEDAPVVAPANGIKVAVVGSGPAGLAFAGDMAKLGFSVTVFEALHDFGGVLRYGIPEFRLPGKVIDHEINNLRQLGVDFQNNVVVGKTLTYEDLHEMGYKGVFVGAGAGIPRFMNIPGECLRGVMSSNEYLIRINLMHASRGGDTPVLKGRTVAVIGGGNTAFDATRTALRQGAEKVMLVYRRTEVEMPACMEERELAKEEGAVFMTLHNPVEYIGDENGHVKMMRVQQMKLGEPDDSGRRSPVPIEGAIIEVPVDLVIVAVGVSANSHMPRTVEGLEMTRWNTIVVNEETQQSSISDLYAGGDITRGGATVILAMGDGRRAAKNMAKQLLDK